MVSQDDALNREARDGLARIVQRIKILENNDYFNILYGEAEWVSSCVPVPPTLTIIQNVFGKPTSFNALVMEAVLINTYSGEAWLLHSSSVQDKWYYSPILVEAM